MSIPNLASDELAVLEALADHTDKGHDVMLFDDLGVRELSPGARRRIDLNLIDRYIELFGRRRASGDPHLVRLTAEGQQLITAIRRIRNDAGRRRRECRNRLLAWVYEKDGDSSPPSAKEFLTQPQGNFFGSPFELSEVRLAADYLGDAGLVTLHKVSGNAIMEIDHDGRRCVELFDGSVAAWEGRNMGSGSKVEFNGGTFNAPVTAAVAGRDIGSVNQTVSSGVDPQKVTDWLAGVQALLPVANLPAAELAQVEQRIAELRAHLDSGQLEPARRTGNTLVGVLTNALMSSPVPTAIEMFGNILSIGATLFS